MQRVSVKLEIPVKINFNELGITKEDFSKHLELCINEDRCNRPPFDVELLMHGFIRLVKSSIKDAIEKVHQKKYQKEHIDTQISKNVISSTPKWRVTSLPYISKIRLDIVRAFKGMVS